MRIKQNPNIVVDNVKIDWLFFFRFETNEWKMAILLFIWLISFSLNAVYALHVECVRFFVDWRVFWRFAVWCELKNTSFRFVGVSVCCTVYREIVSRAALDLWWLIEEQLPGINEIFYTHHSSVGICITINCDIQITLMFFVFSELFISFSQSIWWRSQTIWILFFSSFCCLLLSLQFLYRSICFSVNFLHACLHLLKIRREY